MQHRFTLGDACPVAGTSTIASGEGDLSVNDSVLLLATSTLTSDLGVAGRQSESVPGRASFICDR